MNNIKKAFENKALICFLMAGDPDLNTTKEVIISMAKAGCDMVELGVPFSDPIAESSVVQSANLRALKSETYLKGIFDMIQEVRNTTQISIILHTYINPVFNYRYEEFFMKCSEVNVCGIVVPDLPYEEKSEIKEYADKYGVDIISFVVPENIDRVKMIAKEASFPLLTELFAEYENKQTPEAKLANDLDKLDMLAQALDYETKYANKNFEEFKLSAIKNIQTEIGKKLAQELLSEKNI